MMAASIQGLVDFIVRAENGGSLNWDSVYGGVPKVLRPKVPVTSMTVAEVVVWQAGIRGKTASTAVGGPQFIAKTLAGLVARGFSPADKFSATTQSNMAVSLMRGRGLDKYLSGTMTAEAFANELAKEWASLPVVSGPKAGRSYYAGDGLNNSLVTVPAFLAAVRAVRGPGAAEPTPRVGLWQTVLNWIRTTLI